MKFEVNTINEIIECGFPIEISLGVPYDHIITVLRKNLNEYSPKEKSLLIRINDY